MKDVLRQIAAGQAGCVASWQLRRAGLSWHAIAHRTRDLRRLHDGVFLTGDAPATRLQRWWAATLTAPGSVLAFASAGAAYEMRPWDGGFEVIVRQGAGGPKRQEPSSSAARSTSTPRRSNGLPITTARAHARRSVATRRRPRADAPQRAAPQAPDHHLPRCPSGQRERPSASAFAGVTAGEVPLVEAAPLPLRRRGRRGRDPRTTPESPRPTSTSASPARKPT